MKRQEGSEDVMVVKDRKERKDKWWKWDERKKGKKK